MQNKFFRAVNLLVLTALLIPALYLDPFIENYSSLTREIEGYGYVFFLGLLIGLLLAYECNTLGFRLSGLIISIGFILPCIIPYDYDPSTLKANIHVFFAWLGFYLSLAGGIANVFRYWLFNPDKGKIIVSLSIIFGMIGAYSYFNWMCVNTLCELSFTIGMLVVHWLMLEFNKIKKTQ